MSETRLCMITEHSPFMMSFVFLTAAGRAVIVDGGRPSDMPYLFEIVGTRPIAAWILTHPHVDHISGFNEVVASRERDAQIERVYYNFPSVEYVRRYERESEVKTSTDFARLEPIIRDRAVIIQPGMRAQADELNIEFLYCNSERGDVKRIVAINENSAVFRVTAPGMRSVLFLGDLGPEGGRTLLKTCPEKLPSQIVQMAHHGHMCVTREVYEKIMPEACMWCAPDWLWEEKDVEFEPEIWGLRHTRRWMENLGVVENYVTKDGTQWIPLKG